MRKLQRENVCFKRKKTIIENVNCKIEFLKKKIRKANCTERFIN